MGLFSGMLWESSKIFPLQLGTNHAQMALKILETLKIITNNWHPGYFPSDGLENIDPEAEETWVSFGVSR